MTNFLDVSHYLYEKRVDGIVHRLYLYDKIREFYSPNMKWISNYSKEQVLYHYDDYLDESIDTHTILLTFRFDYEYDFVNYLLHWKLK